MKSLVRIIVVSSLVLAAGCVSHIVISLVSAALDDGLSMAGGESYSYEEREHYSLVPCNAVTTAEIARLVEEGASKDGRVWNANISSHEEWLARRYKLRDGTTISSESSPIHFGTNTVCVSVAYHKERDYIQIADSINKTTAILGRHRAGHGCIMPCAASFGSGVDERLVVVKAPRTYHNWSVVYVFDQSFRCVWQSDEVKDRGGWQAVLSPKYPDTIFLYNKYVGCYRLGRWASISVTSH